MAHTPRFARSRSQWPLNPRFAGQYYDEETGLHDNLNRSYDPRPIVNGQANPNFGKYLTPDPLGYPDGPDAYFYAAGDPVNKMDPWGLYSTEVHYYMTYFLARLAGIETQEALTIALAAQFIDDNSYTNPVNIFSSIPQATRLSLYHFTQAGYDPPQAAQGEPAQAYAWRRVGNPWNPQFQNLINASNRAPNRCAKTQLFGEFIHTYADTFAHRDRDNVPINVNSGVGHGHHGLVESLNCCKLIGE